MWKKAGIDDMGSQSITWGTGCRSSEDCRRSVTIATENELNLVTDPYLFLICWPLGARTGNQLENNPVTYYKENYPYLFTQTEGGIFFIFFFLLPRQLGFAPAFNDGTLLCNLTWTQLIIKESRDLGFFSLAPSLF